MATENKRYIPALRFPEFQNDGEWKKCKLSDIAIRKGKKNTKGIELPVYTNSAASGVVNQEDYFDREIVTQDNLVNYGIIEPDDFVYNPRVSVAAPVGPISRNKLSIGIMSPLYLIFGFNDGDINFFEHYFRGNSWHNYLKSKANYGARFDRINIGTKEFMDMPMPYPIPAEQKKIADCLSSLDKYIDATKRKLELLKEHKKGLMQKLFPAKGKTMPELRFSEFNDDGEWKICKLSDIAIRKGRKNTKGIELPIYTNSATSGVINQEDYFDREIVTQNNLVNYGIIEPDDFVYNPRVSVAAPVGPISRNKLSIGIMSPLYLIFGFNDGDINFFEHYFRGNSWHNYLKAKANYGARFDRINIGIKEFLDMPIPYPSLAEQKKIADYLSSLDDTIKSYDDKISALEFHKKGLMQQLFPKL